MNYAVISERKYPGERIHCFTTLTYSERYREEGAGVSAAGVTYAARHRPVTEGIHQLLTRRVILRRLRTGCTKEESRCGRTAL